MVKLGCLVVHGWSANPSHIRRLVPHLERLELPYRMPLLRGHGMRPQDLQGVTWRDWCADVEHELNDLLQEADKVIVVGHSMGGLLALRLGAARPEAIAGIVCLAAALRVRNPLFPFSPYLAPLYRKHRRNIRPGYSDPACMSQDASYPWVPATAVVQLYRLIRAVEPQLPHVRAPVLLIHSTVDQVVSSEAVEIIYRNLGSTEKQIAWSRQSGHEMLLDCEADDIATTAEAFIVSRRQELLQPVV